MKVLKVMHDAKIILVDLEVNIGNKKKIPQHYVLNTKVRLFL